MGSLIVLNSFAKTTTKGKVLWWWFSFFVLVVAIAAGITGFKIGKEMALEDRKAEAQELVNK